MRIQKTFIALCLLYCTVGLSWALADGDTTAVVSTGDTSLTITGVPPKQTSAAEETTVRPSGAKPAGQLDEDMAAESLAEERRVAKGRLREERRYRSLRASERSPWAVTDTEYQRSIMTRLQQDLSLTDAQLSEITDILSANLQQKNKSLDIVRRQYSRQREDLVSVLTPEQLEKAAGLFIQREMAPALMPGPGDTGFRKFRTGKPRPEATPLGGTDLEGESKALESLQGEE